MSLILDNIVIFLWRQFAHWFREARCRNWPLVSGKIDNVDCPKREMYPYAEIHYVYRIGASEFDSRSLRGFWESESALNLAKRYRRLKRVAVRYSADNTARSYVLDKDQDFR